MRESLKVPQTTAESPKSKHNFDLSKIYPVPVNNENSEQLRGHESPFFCPVEGVSAKITPSEQTSPVIYDRETGVCMLGDTDISSSLDTGYSFFEKFGEWLNDSLEFLENLSKETTSESDRSMRVWKEAVRSTQQQHIFQISHIVYYREFLKEQRKYLYSFKV